MDGSSFIEGLGVEKRQRSNYTSTRVLRFAFGQLSFALGTYVVCVCLSEDAICNEKSQRVQTYVHVFITCCYVKMYVL